MALAAFFMSGFPGWRYEAHAQSIALPGKFAVNETGAATYEVAITVPPGTAGMFPSLSLTYNSQSGNGLVGMGWQLQGVPSVARCPRTMAQDGIRGGINYDADDRFCLDGQRLIAINGTDGADGTEYRTEIESFAKIVSHGSAGTGPAWFEVRTKTGQVMEFGNSSDSRILAQGKTETRTWGASKVSDTKGNYYTISYVNDTANGEAYPTRIDYTGNSGADLVPYNSVRFVYTTDRPDWTVGYHAGSMLRSTVRLANIQTYAGDSLVADYRLSYAQGTSTGRSQLTSITLCTGAGNCLPATNFTWQQGGSGPLSFTKYSNVISKLSGTGSGYYEIDIDGNGVTDFMGFNRNDTRNRWYLNQGVVNGPPSFTIFDDLINTNDIQYSSPHFGDWNRDGRTDVMFWNQHTGENYWWVNNGIQNGTPSLTRYPTPIATGLIDEGTFFTGDWNGDGLTDAAWLSAENGHNRWFINNGIADGAINFTRIENPIATSQIEGYSIQMGDWNGDGFADLLTYKDSGTNRWFINNGMVNGTLGFAVTTNPVPTGDVDGDSSWLTSDLNGDGLTDFAWTYYGTSRWFLSKGVSNGTLSFTPMYQPIPNVGNSVQWQHHIVDVNDDGFSDVLTFRAFEGNGQNRWFVSKSGRWSEPFIETTNPIARGDIDDGHSVQFGDWDGNGSTDALFFDDGTDRWFINNRAKPDILTQITTGVGATTSITYKVLTDSTVYTKDTTSTYPIADLQGPMQVVGSIDLSNGIGGLRSIAYTYAGAKLHVDGRGFLGFREIKTTDQQTGITQTTSYRQDFPFNGFIASEVRTHNGATLSSTANTYEARDLGGPRRHVFLSQSLTTAVDLDGTALPSVTSTYQYDEYGNATEITVTHSDGYSKTTTNTYTNDTANWLLGRLTAASVTSTAPAVDAQAPPTDANPDPFDFNDVINAAVDTVYESSAVISGVNRVLTATVSGGDAQVRTNGAGDWASSVQVIPGETLNIRMTSGATYGSVETATLTIGDLSSEWSITAATLDRVLTFSENVNSLNLRTYHDSLYPPLVDGEPTSVTAIIEPGVIVGSSSTATPSFDVGDWPSGVTVTVNVKGRIQGAGGDGGRATPNNEGIDVGKPGGPALYTRYPINLVLNEGAGEIWGGGGGGGGDYASGGSTIGAGGGGAGQIPGAGGVSRNRPNGQPGTTEAGGLGERDNNDDWGGDGGDPGQPGGSSRHGISGGAAGNAIDAVSVVINQTGTGDLRGPVLGGGGPCSGVEVGSYCWHLGAAGQSCDAVCSGYGSCDLAGTRDYAGSGGTLANCQSVAASLGLAVTGQNTTEIGAVGCAYFSFGEAGSLLRATSPATSCAATYPLMQRICACSD